MRRFLGLSLLLLFSTLSTSLFGVSSANASSWLDGQLDRLMTNSAIVTCGGESVDFSKIIYSTLNPETTEISGVPIVYVNSYPPAAISRADLYDLAQSKLDDLKGYAVSYTKPEFYPNGRALYYFQNEQNKPLSFIQRYWAGSPYAWELTDNEPLGAYAQIYCRPDLNNGNGAFLIDASAGSNAGTFSPLADSIPPASEYNQIVYVAQDITYPEGYDGIEVPGDITAAEQLRPLFNWSLQSKGLLQANYTGNLTKDKEPGGWRYRLYPADSDGNPIGDDPLADKTYKFTDLGHPFNHQFTSFGAYQLYITPVYPPPLLPKTDISDVRFEIIYDGTFKVNGNLYCEEGICRSPPENCADFENLIERMACQVRHRFDFGVINPSIANVVQLLSSMRASADPSCGLNLPNAHYLGRTFPVSQIDNVACSQAQQVHTHFPIVAIIVNFTFALFALWVVGRFINKISNPDDEDLITGV